MCAQALVQHDTFVNVLGPLSDYRNVQSPVSSSDPSIQLGPRNRDQRILIKDRFDLRVVAGDFRHLTVT